MATEEQTQYNASNPTGYLTTSRSGQRLTITNRSVSKLGFWLHKVGTPPGNVTFAIYAVDDDEVLASKLLGTADSLTTSPVYYEVTFDSPVSINEAVYIAVVDTESSGTDYIRVSVQGAGDVKADEIFAAFYLGAWHTSSGADCAYIYTYTVLAPPTVTTQAVTDIAPTTATGNGNITDLGGGSVTQHGVCWNTGGTPTTANDKTEEGVAGATGAFTSSITDLIANTLYYVRAYATSEYGTSYGAEVSFTTLVKTPEKGTLWQEGTKVHIIDENEAEQSWEGTFIARHTIADRKAHLWMQDFLTSFMLYIDEENIDRRRLDGTPTGVTGQPEGTLFIEGAHLHGIDESGDERYL